MEFTELNLHDERDEMLFTAIVKICMESQIEKTPKEVFDEIKKEINTK